MLKTLKRTVAANQRTKLRFKLSRRARRLLGKALKRHGRAAARVTVKVTNADGKSASGRLKIRAKR